ncbi:MAG: glycosyltransferase family 2 protein [Bacteroidales bacterium]|nr:glycosyltransferase family 2 protein [Bacteroidales bacterium]
MVKFIFWLFIGLLIYSYIGYTIIILFISFIKKFFPSNRGSNKENSASKFPEVTIIIAAYNEEKNVDEKVKNTFQQDYPHDKITQVWVNDCSFDKTKDLVAEYPNVTLLNQIERQGKVAAINFAMQYVKTPIVIFSDANAMLSAEAINNIVKPFSNPKVGCVAGEKRILMNPIENAAATGEGIYWKYESFIKQIESTCGSTLSATGELYAIRTELFEEVKKDTILDDFIISTHVIKKGYLVKYVPDAYACEKASANINEEKKRKIRIAAGSFQALFRSMELLNPLKHPLFSFQFFSHKILRWFVLPISLLLLPILNVLILLLYSQSTIYQAILIIQIFVLLMIFSGWLFKDKQISTKWVFLPFYLFMMNISIVQGFIRYVNGKQNVKWDKSLRQT